MTIANHYMFIIINDNRETMSSTCTFDFQSIFNYEWTPLEVNETITQIIEPLQYLCGYFLKKIFILNHAVNV